MELKPVQGGVAHAVVVWHTQILNTSHRLSTDPSETSAKQVLYYLSAGDATRQGRPVGVRVYEQQELLLVLRWQPRSVEMELKAAAKHGPEPAHGDMSVQVGALGAPRDAGAAVVSELPGVGRVGKKAAEDIVLPVGFSSRIDLTQRQRFEREHAPPPPPVRVPAARRLSSKDLLADAMGGGEGVAGGDTERDGESSGEAGGQGDDGEGREPRTSVLDGATLEIVDESDEAAPPSETEAVGAEGRAPPSDSSQQSTAPPSSAKASSAPRCAASAHPAAALRRASAPPTPRYGLRLGTTLAPSVRVSNQNASRGGDGPSALFEYHFPMIADDGRNDAFAATIGRAVTRFAPCVPVLRTLTVLSILCGVQT